MAKGVYLHIQNLEKELDEVGNELGKTPENSDLKDKETLVRFSLASSYQMVGEYEKAIGQFNQIRERIELRIELWSYVNT